MNQNSNSSLKSVSGLVLSNSTVGDERQVIRSDQRGGGSVQRYPLKFEFIVEIDVIEMQERQYAGIGFRPLEVNSNVRACQVRGKQSRSQTPGPLIEVSQHDFRSTQLFVVQYRLVHKLSALMPSLDERGAEMNVNNVQAATIRSDVCAEAASLFAAANADVVVHRFEQRQAAQDDISVDRPAVNASSADRVVHSHAIRYEAGLIFLTQASWMAQHFLKRNDVGIDLAQDLHDSRGTHATI